MMPFEDIQFQIVDLPPIGNESTDGWVSGILRIADILTLVIDLSEEPVIQVDLLMGQLSEWKIPLLRKDDRRDEERGFSSKPVILVGNKLDLSGTKDGLKAVQQEYQSMFPVAGISTKNKQGIEELRRAVFENSQIIRVYSKEPGKESDLRTPFTLPAGSSVIRLAELIHKDFVRNLKYACIWGSAKFAGQRVHKDYVLHDRDVVEFHVR
jgi:ribosome-interacting GTPase 1